MVLSGASSRVASPAQRPHKVLLTGASGMTGQHIAALLHRENVKVYGTSRTPPKHMDFFSAWQPLDLKTLHTIDMCDVFCDDIDAVIHAGAAVDTNVEQTSTLVDVNVRASLILGQWALQQRIPLIFLSGAIVYEDVTARSTTEEAPLAWNGGFGGFYGLSKVLGEQVLHFLCQQGLQCTILRPSSIYGAGLPQQKIVPQWLALAKQHQTISIFPPHNQYINLVHASDVARAVWLSLTHNAYGKYNILGFTHTLQDIANACLRCYGEDTALLQGETCTQDAYRFDICGKQAKKILHYTPQISLDKGLSMIITGKYLPSV